MFNSSKFQGFKDERKENIRQLFRATDFQSLMYPCFTFGRILGIFPCKFNASRIKTCKPSYILSIIIISIFSVCELINLIDIIIYKNIAFISVPRTLERCCFYIFGGFIVIATFILKGSRMRLLQTILDLSLRLPQESYRNLSKLIHAKDIFGFALLVIVQVLLNYFIQIGVLRKILVMYITLLVFQMDMLYMNCVCILKACFKQINDSLVNLRLLMANDEPYLLKGIYHEQRNPFLLMELNALKKQHLTISDTVRKLKTTFSLQLLCTIIMTYIYIIFNLYFYLVRIQGSVSMSKQEKQVYYDSFITSATYYIIKITLIIWACETGKNQAMKINTTVHEVFNSTSDKEIKYEVNLKNYNFIHIFYILFNYIYIYIRAAYTNAIFNILIYQIYN